jgi:spore maturation protein CgeB
VPLDLVVFGLSVSSSFGNGHATLWRGFARALAEAGGRLTFFERDVEWYANHRDGWTPPAGEIVLYREFRDVRERARAAARSTDIAIVTSFCPDGAEAGRLVCEHALRAVFYDLDTPVTLGKLERGDSVPWLGPEGLQPYDLVLSYTGGRALDALKKRLGARRAVPLYGHVDPDAHRPGEPDARFSADLAYLGTYAADRQAGVDELFVAPAHERPDMRFLVGGAMYPADIRWPSNVRLLDHVGPPDHPAFFASSRLQLNVTRGDMAAMGWCPSGRLFEAAACGAAIVTDVWTGLDAFFAVGEELLPAREADDVLAALDRPAADLRRIGEAARERVLAEHTSAHRVAELVAALGERPAPSREAALAEG